MVELGSDQGRSFQLDLVGPAGASPSHPRSFAQPGDSGGKTIEGRELCLGVGEFVGTGTAAVLAGGVYLRLLRPASFITCTKLGGSLHHKIHLPILEFPETQFTVGVLLVRQKLHIIGGHAAGCRAEVVLVDADKLVELPPQPLPMFPALLSIVRLPTWRFEFDVALANAPPHSVDMLVSPDVGILDYTDPGLRQRDALTYAPDGPLSPADFLPPRPPPHLRSPHARTR